MLGVRVDHVFVERGVSGSKPLRERPQGAKLLKTIAFGDWVITPKLDRMFRSSLDAISTLTEMRDVIGIHLHMIDLGGMSLEMASPSSCSRSSAPWRKPSEIAFGSGSRT